MKLFLLGASLFLALSSCNSGKQKVEPQCIQDQVTEFSESVLCETGASVNEYKFSGELVYVFDNGNCGADFSQKVLDSDCNVLGFLGGISGNTEIAGKNFDEKAELERTLYEN